MPDQLDVPPPVPPLLQIDRRAVVRQVWRRETPGHLSAVDCHEARWVRVQDLTASGVGLVLPHDYEPGTALLVELHNLKEGYARTLRVRVMHSTSQGDGTWLVGCALFEPLPDAELQKLL
jgi:PilZ domain